jgi:hypothetical protein
MGFHLDEVSCLRVLDPAHIDEFIARRKEWREIAQQRWINGRQKHSTIMSRSWKEITEKTVADLHVLAQCLLVASGDFKLVVSVHQGYVYTNDTALLEQLDALPELSYKNYTRSKVTRPRDTIQLRNPTHAYRTYLKMVKLNNSQKDQLINFLQNQSAHVRLSPALIRWLTQPFNRTQDYFFVDHQAKSWLTMLGLVQPGIVRKTLAIISAK